MGQRERLFDRGLLAYLPSLTFGDSPSHSRRVGYVGCPLRVVLGRLEFRAGGLVANGQNGGVCEG